MIFYNGNTNYREEIRDYINKNIRKYRMTSIITGVIMLLLGILCMIFPIQSVLVMAVLLSITMIVLGAVKIATYARSPLYIRSGLLLMNGILDVLLGILLLTSGRDVMLFALSYLFAFELISTGIESIAISDRMHFFGFANTSSYTVSGIISLIVGIILLFVPNASLVTLSVIVTIFLIVEGILFIVDGVRMKELKFDQTIDM